MQVTEFAEEVCEKDKHINIMKEVRRCLSEPVVTGRFDRRPSSLLDLPRGNPTPQWKVLFASVTVLVPTSTVALGRRIFGVAGWAWCPAIRPSVGGWAWCPATPSVPWD